MLKRMAVLAGVLLLAGGTATWADESQARQSVHKMFEDADKNKDGKLDKDELAKAFRGNGAKGIEHKETDKKTGKDEQHADHKFLEKYDKDKDGAIDRKEFEAYEKDFEEQVKRAQQSARRKRIRR